MSNTALRELVKGNSSGGIQITDLTATLEPDTPTMHLTTEFGCGFFWPFSNEDYLNMQDGHTHGWETASLAYSR